MAKLIEKQKLSNGEIAVRLRPDAATDDTHDSWHTKRISASTTAAEITTWLTSCRSDVEAQHAAMLAADALLQGLLS